MDFNIYQEDLNRIQDKLSTPLSEEQKSAEIHTLRLFNQKIFEKKDQLDDIEIKLKENRQKWNEYLVLVEDAEQLRNEMEKMFIRIEKESNTYRELME